VIQQPNAICNTISRKVGEVLDETDISPDPREEAIAVPTDSIVDNQPNTSPLDISTAEQSSDENTHVSVQGGCIGIASNTAFTLCAYHGLTQLLTVHHD